MVVAEDCTILFKEALFKPPNNPAKETEGAHLRRPLAGGRMVVTSKRILFICLRGSGWNKINKERYGNYSVHSTIIHTRVYFPIDLADVCGIRFCTKDAQTNECICLDSDATESDGKPLILTLGLKLPPWGEACEIEVRISEDVSFDTLKRVVSSIEENRLSSDTTGAAKTVARASTPPTTQVSEDGDPGPADFTDDINAAAAAVRGPNAWLVVA